MVIFTIFAADMSGFDFIHKDKLPVLPVIQLHSTPAVPAVPQTVVMPASVRRFIIDQQHILLQAVHLCIIEYAQQPPIQRNEINLRSAAANIKDAVMKLLPCLFTGQAVGRQPDPGRGEIPAPVLVGIAVGFFRRDGILPAVKMIVPL